MSKVTADEIKKLLDSGAQSIVFNNRKGDIEYNGRCTDKEGVTTIGEALKTNTSLKKIDLGVDK